MNDNIYCLVSGSTRVKMIIRAGKIHTRVKLTIVI